MIKIARRLVGFFATLGFSLLLFFDAPARPVCPDRRNQNEIFKTFRTIRKL